MRTLILFSLLYSFTFMSCNSQKRDKEETVAVSPKVDTAKVVKLSNKEWRSILSSEQYHILREKGTDKPFTGKYYLTNDKGVYQCAACGNELFTSDMKFDSDCGWPSFDKALEGGKIKTAPDNSYGMLRTEILCARCGGHLGHLFEDGPTETGLRYCVNSTSLNFVKEK